MLEGGGGGDSARNYLYDNKDRFCTRRVPTILGDIIQRIENLFYEYFKTYLRTYIL